MKWGVKMIFEKIRERLNELYDTNDKSKKKAYEEHDWETFNILSRINEGAYMAINIVNEVEAEYKDGWIKCEGKTFAVGCKYLVVDDKNDIYIATYLNDNVFIARDKNYFMPIRLEATYCQLLPLPPQPPKGE